LHTVAGTSGSSGPRRDNPHAAPDTTTAATTIIEIRMRRCRKTVERECTGSQSVIDIGFLRRWDEHHGVNYA